MCTDQGKTYGTAFIQISGILLSVTQPHRNTHPRMRHAREVAEVGVGRILRSLVFAFSPPKSLKGGDWAIGKARSGLTLHFACHKLMCMRHTKSLAHNHVRHFEAKAGDSWGSTSQNPSMEAIYSNASIETSRCASTAGPSQ
jgi:hypothetical protein